MKPKNWDQLTVTSRREYVRDCFASGEVKKASRDDLEDYLIAMAYFSFDGVTHDDREGERFSAAIRHLIQNRISEELHRRSFRLSLIAIVIGFVGVVIGALLTAWLRSVPRDKDDHRVSYDTPKELFQQPPKASMAPTPRLTTEAKKEPNQSPEPKPPMAVTPPAAQEPRQP